MATNGNVNHGGAESFAASSTDAASSSGSTNNLSKDEVGWYFVEQFYTTLSKAPEKLHLFYGKRSQFVNGQEKKKVDIAVGRQAIQERIKALDFQTCKVRISNVDSQASLDNIIIQVIGETSNKGDTPKKFVQTFVLAQQPSGYFVLNDILRYINEDGDEDTAEATGVKEPVPTAEPEAELESEAASEPEPEVARPAGSPQAEAGSAELDAEVVHMKLEEASTDPTPSAAIHDLEQSAAEPEEKESVDPEQAAQEVAAEDAEEPEAPQDPSPTPVVQRAAPPAAAEPEKPKGPPKPMTWASRAAAAAGPVRPVVPLPKTATPPATAPVRAPVPAAAQQSAAVPSQAKNEASSTPAPKEQDEEWQPARADAKRQNRPQSISRPPTEKDSAMAYIKYVTETVKEEDLRSALASFGELAYFDINRQKNCAFVEFATQVGYSAAVAANPHTVNGESIVVEQRRPKANAYGGSNYSASRGGALGQRGRGGFEGNRTSSQGGPRGGFNGQARGGRGGGATRGRGAPQATNA